MATNLPSETDLVSLIVSYHLTRHLRHNDDYRHSHHRRKENELKEAFAQTRITSRLLAAVAYPILSDKPADISEEEIGMLQFVLQHPQCSPDVLHEACHHHLLPIALTASEHSRCEAVDIMYVSLRIR